MKKAFWRPSLFQMAEPLVLEGDMLDMVDRFCCLGDTIGTGSAARECTVTRVRCAWNYTPLKITVFFGFFYRLCLDLDVWNYISDQTIHSASRQWVPGATVLTFWWRFGGGKQQWSRAPLMGLSIRYKCWEWWTLSMCLTVSSSQSIFSLSRVVLI